MHRPAPILLRWVSVAAAILAGGALTVLGIGATHRANVAGGEHAFAALRPAASGAGTNLIRISSDPYSNATGQHATEADSDAFSYRRTTVSVFGQGLSNVVNGGASGIGFATSHDGGRTWIHGSLPGLGPDGPFAGVASPAVAYDRRNRTWLVSVVAAIPDPADPTAPPQQSMTLVSRSIDDGPTWRTGATTTPAEKVHRNVGVPRRRTDLERRPAHRR